MSDLERLILLCFGGMMLASVFVFYQFGRVVALSLKDRRSGRVLQDGEAREPITLSLCLCTATLGIFGNGAVRVYDGLSANHFGGSNPGLLALFIGMIWIAKSGFHWIASAKRRWPWYLYLALVAVWIGVVIYYPFPRA